MVKFMKTVSKTKKDWVSFYGDHEKQPTYEMALDYYEDISDHYCPLERGAMPVGKAVVVWAAAGLSPTSIRLTNAPMR